MSDTGMVSPHRDTPHDDVPIHTTTVDFWDLVSGFWVLGFGLQVTLQFLTPNSN